MQLYRKVDAPNRPFTHVFAEAGWPWLLFGLFLTSLTGVGLALGLPAALQEGGIAGAAMLLMGGLVAALTGGVGVFCINGYRASRRPTNWLLRYCADGFLINLRHFANAHLAEDAPTKVWIGSSEVARIRKYTHRSKRRDHRGSVSTVVHKHLEIVLHSQDTEQLAAAIEHELRQPPAGRIVRSKVKQAAVSVPEPGIVRLAWGGSKATVRPSLKRALAVFAQHHALENDIRKESDFRTLADAELEEHLIELAEAGDTIGAAVIARERYGMSVTEARAFLDELSGRRKADVA